MPTRYLLIVGTFLLAMLLYVDRVCLSAAKDTVAADLGFDDRAMGWVFGAFSLGYALCQTPAGMIADRFGPRRVLTLVVCCWSLFTALTAAVRGFPGMLLVRFCFGVGEAGAFPGTSRAFFSWLPMSERGIAYGINFSASRLGTAFALPGVAWLVAVIGWRATFVSLGVAGLVWAVIWYAWFRDDPTEHPGTSPEERAHILEHRQRADDNNTLNPAPLRVRSVLASSTMWFVMAQYFASNFTVYFCLTWLPSYLKAQYGISMIAAGWMAIPVFVGGMLGNWTGGVLVDGIYRRGHWVGSRRLPAIIGFLFAAIGMILCVVGERQSAIVIGGMSLALFGADMTLAPSWSTCTDIGRRHAGAVSGTMNMAGNIGAFVTGLAFPYLQKWTGSTAPYFLVAAILSGLATFAWLLVRPDRPLQSEDGE